MAVIETGPSSSYSDPIYDRLDTVAQRLARRWPLAVVAVLLIVGVAVVARLATGEDAATSSLHAYLTARGESDDAKRNDALRKLAADERATPIVRARANSDLVQIDLDAGDTAAARTHAAAALEYARASEDAGMELEARLAQAAVAEDAGEFDPALKAYQEVAVGAAAATQPALQLTAALGAARILQKQGDLDGALNRLEGVITNKAPEARMLVSYGQWLYWQIKRQQAGAPDALVSAPQAAAPSEAASAGGTPAAPADGVQGPAAPAPADATAPEPAATPAGK